jgi:hypothetical protein
MENKEIIELMNNIYIQEAQTKDNFEDYIECLNELRFLTNNLINNLSFEEEVEEYVEMIYKFTEEMSNAVQEEEYEYAAKIRNLIEFEELLMLKYVTNQLNETPEIAFFIIESTKEKVKNELL